MVQNVEHLNRIWKMRKLREIFEIPPIFQNFQTEHLVAVDGLKYIRYLPKVKFYSGSAKSRKSSKRQHVEFQLESLTML